MKKIFAFVLTAITALGFMGWGALSTQAATTYTAGQVAQHNVASDCWLIISGQVYDVTNFIPIHPGGNAIVPYCGTDASAVFDSIHNQSAFALLPTYLIGTVGISLTAPTNLAGVPASTAVVLSWTASTGGVSPLTYTIKRNGASVATTTATTFTDASLIASTTYAYMIQVTDSATPGANSTSSAQISVTTLANGSSTAPLTAPGNFVGVPAQTSVALSWTASTGGVSPVVYAVFKNGTSVGTTTSTTFASTGLIASTTYTFVVRATDSATPAANSTSSAITVTTLAGKSGGGEQENEMENEQENENVAATTRSAGGGEDGRERSATSTRSTVGGGNHGQEHQTGFGGSVQRSGSSSSSHISNRQEGND